MHIDIYVAIAGLIVGFVVGMTGMGGGALMTPILVLLFKVEPLAAVSSDLVAAMIMKPVGAAVHARRKTVNWNLVRWLSVGSVPAAFAGVFVLRLLGDSDTVQDRIKIFLGVTLLIACAALVVKPWIEERRARRLPENSTDDERLLDVKKLRTVAIGVVGGLMVGMTSVGSGSVIIIALMMLYPRMRGKQLVGTDLTQAIPLVFAAGVAHILFGDFVLGLTASVLLGSIPGVYLGARASAKAPDWVIRPALVFVLFASGLKLVNVGTLQLGIVLAIVPILTLPIMGAIDAYRRPEHDWDSAGYHKRVWVRLQAIGALFGFGFAAAIAYFTRTRPRLEAVAQYAGSTGGLPLELRDFAEAYYRTAYWVLDD